MVASVDLMSIMWQRMRSKIFAAWNPISIFSSVYLAKSEDRGFSRRTEWTAFQTTWNDKKPVNLVIPGLLLMKDDSDSLLLTRAPKEMGMEQCDHNDSCSLSYEFLDSFLLPFSTNSHMEHEHCSRRKWKKKLSVVLPAECVASGTEKEWLINFNLRKEENGCLV